MSLADDRARAGSGWLQSPARSGARERRWLLIAMALFVALNWLVISPHGINASWRECDTQAIARNFLVDGFDPLRPRVDWRGDTDGAVECEFPLYQSLVAGALSVFGDVEWPGRLLSLFAVLLTVLSVHRLLEWRAGPSAALAGSLVFLSGGQAVLLSSRVAPDSLSLALAVAGLVTFLRYLQSGSPSALWLAVAATAFAALQKPTALQIGLLLFTWTVILAPKRLGEVRLWAGFAVILVAVGVWLAHAAGLHAETGLTFGVISGGDTKFPDLAHLLDPSLHVHLIKTTARYGISMFGGVALVVLAVRRRFDRADFALLGTVLLGLVGTLRYSHQVGMGAHYHVFAAIAGAFFVARAWPQKAPRWAWALFAVAIAAHGGWQFARERRLHVVNAGAELMQVAAALREASEDDERVIVWAEKPTFDEFWQRRNNYEDPRILYQARRRGWVLPADGLDVERLEELEENGARFLVDTAADRATPELSAWLAQRAEVVCRTHRMLVYRLRPSP
jgi:4-amino-4-deoxy-L-arabinose transferase-like glycosyltransferase